MSQLPIKKPLQYMMNTGAFHDEEQAMKVLKASLQALRDRLPKMEAFHLGKILQEYLRSNYFEGWHNGQRQATSLNKSDFLSEVELHLIDFDQHSLAELVPVAMRALLKMLDITSARHIKDALPGSMQEIFEDRLSME